MTIIHFETRAKQRGVSLAVDQPAVPTILSTMEDFTDSLFERGLRPRGVDCYIRDLRKFVVFLG